MKLKHREVKYFGRVRQRRVMDKCFLLISAAFFSDVKKIN